MMTLPVSIKIRCESCHTSFSLSQEQYRELIKQSRVRLSCPQCAHTFDYDPVSPGSAPRSDPAPRPRRVPAVAEADPLPPRVASAEVPPAPAPAATPDFPPPPFAPLGRGNSAQSNAAAPDFAPLGGGQFAPAPASAHAQGSAAPTESPAKKLTLNERFKQLPSWMQWTVIGVAVVILAIVIFAIPTGGSNGPAKTDSSGAVEQAPKNPEKDRPSGDKKTSEDSKSQLESRSGDEKKLPGKATDEDRQP